MFLDTQVKMSRI